LHDLNFLLQQVGSLLRSLHFLLADNFDCSHDVRQFVPRQYDHSKAALAQLPDRFELGVKALHLLDLLHVLGLKFTQLHGKG
jgi:hypothetical protein